MADTLGIDTRPAKLVGRFAPLGGPAPCRSWGPELPI